MDFVLVNYVTQNKKDLKKKDPKKDTNGVKMHGYAIAFLWVALYSNKKFKLENLLEILRVD